jgi:protein SHQ1
MYAHIYIASPHLLPHVSIPFPLFFRKNANTWVFRRLIEIFFFAISPLALDLASPQETRSLYLTLLTLLFAYAYDARTTQHDPTPESAWTIAALTPAFSALDPPPYPPHPQGVRGTGDGGDLDFDDDAAALELELAETLVPSYRRALAFPLYRSWALADACRADAARFLFRGTRTVLRCLLELRAILETHEVYYVYARIWLDDFCRWIQACAR